MNNKFEWNRFGKVVRKDFTDMWRLYGTTMLVLVLVPTTLWLLRMVLNTNAVMPAEPRFQWVRLLVLLGSVMAISRIYRNCNLTNKGIGFAMLPASKGEKFASMLLYSFIVVPLMLTAGLWVADTLLYLLPFGSYKEPLWNSTIWNLSSPFRPNTNFADSALLAITHIEADALPIALFLFTATIFKKHKVTYTFLWLLIAGSVLSILMIAIGAGVATSDNFEGWLESLANDSSLIDEEQLARRLFAITVTIGALLTAAFVWMAGHRLKKMTY